MSRTVTFLLLAIYCALAAFTQVSGDAGQGVSGRVVGADFFALGLFIPAFFVRRHIVFHPNFWFYIAFLASLLASLLLAERPQDGMIEYVVLAFNFAAGVVVFNLCVNARDFSVSDALYAFFYATALIAILSLLKLFFFPDWFGGSGRVAGLTGPFRNTGQSGTYFGMGLALFVPAMAVGLIRRSVLNSILLAIIVLCLVLTVKRAATIGFGVGILGMLLVAALTGRADERRRNLMVFGLALVVAPVAYYLYDYLIQNVAGFEYRVANKVTAFTVERARDKFFDRNYGAAFQAFSDHPFFGVGPNNIVGDYTERYEIHSTPLSILSGGGVIGFALYLAFMLHLYWVVWHTGAGSLMENRFMRLFLPMLIGLSTSWLYTYHIRKREFWILYGIVLFSAHLITRYRESQQRHRQGAARSRFDRRPTSVLARLS